MYIPCQASDVKWKRVSRANTMKKLPTELHVANLQVQGEEMVEGTGMAFIELLAFI